MVGMVNRRVPYCSGQCPAIHIVSNIRTSTRLDVSSTSEHFSVLFPNHLMTVEKRLGMFVDQISQKENTLLAQGFFK